MFLFQQATPMKPTTVPATMPPSVFLVVEPGQLARATSDRDILAM
ncbi:hypothetical protein ABT214_05280 [Micromonospora purpureochromogenes]